MALLVPDRDGQTGFTGTCGRMAKTWEGLHFNADTWEHMSRR